MPTEPNAAQRHPRLAVLTLAAMVLAAVGVVIWRDAWLNERMRVDWLPLDRSVDGPNLLVQVLWTLAAALTLYVVWPNFRGFVDAMLKKHFAHHREVDQAHREAQHEAAATHVEAQHTTTQDHVSAEADRIIVELDQIVRAALEPVAFDAHAAHVIARRIDRRTRAQKSDALTKAIDETRARRGRGTP